MNPYPLRKIYLLALAGMIQSPVPALGADSPDLSASQDRGAMLEARRVSLSSAVAQGDAAAVANHFCVDATLIAPGFDAVVGREAIRKVWSHVLAGGGLARLVFTPMDVGGSDGELLVETGALSSFGKDGKERDRSHYLLVWKREDDEWRIWRDITSPGPAPGPTADRVGFPENYRTKFKMLAPSTLNNRGLVQTPYGNESAASSAESEGRSYPYGSVLVMEFAAAARDTQGESRVDSAGNPQPGEVQHVDVMRREAGFGEAYGKNRAGEWEFVRYRPDGAILVPPAKSASCAECHVKAGVERDFVFPFQPLK